MKNTTFSLWFVLFSAGVGSCGNGSSPASSDAAGTLDAGPPTRGVSDALSSAPGCEHAATLCAKLNECAPFLLAATYGDVATCTTRLTKTCTAQALSDGSGMTSEKLKACKDALASTTCDDVYTNNLPCNFSGSLANGAACGDSNQCVNGFCDHKGALCGVCASKGGLGAACTSGTNDECQSGLVCSQSKTCVAPARVGAACDDSTHPCVAGLFCTLAKTCALMVDAGQECPGAYLDLTKGVVCWGKHAPGTPQVAAQIGTAGIGEPCGLAPTPGQPATLCAPGGTSACSLAAGGIMLFGVPTKGMCAAPVKDGFTCDAASICEPGAQCISNMCTIPSGKNCYTI